MNSPKSVSLCGRFSTSKVWIHEVCYLCFAGKKSLLNHSKSWWYQHMIVLCTDFNLKYTWGGTLFPTFTQNIYFQAFVYNSVSIEPLTFLITIEFQEFILSLFVLSSFSRSQHVSINLMWENPPWMFNGIFLVVKNTRFQHHHWKQNFTDV